MSRYMSARERYEHDPIFHAIVAHMAQAIENLQLTPTEMREAAMLACILFEERRVPRYHWPQDDIATGR
jgi:hypothetical protein